MAVRLGTVCRRHRGQKFRQIDVAVLADVSHNTISYFENGRMVREVDMVVAAYAVLLGLVPEDLWREARTCPASCRASTDGRRQHGEVPPRRVVRSHSMQAEVPAAGMAEHETGRA
jgi:hypothetical protein